MLVWIALQNLASVGHLSLQRIVRSFLGAGNTTRPEPTGRCLIVMPAVSSSIGRHSDVVEPWIGDSQQSLAWPTLTLRYARASFHTGTRTKKPEVDGLQETARRHRNPIIRISSNATIDSAKRRPKNVTTGGGISCLLSCALFTSG